jgi:pimeloyl-ACP methyl ester carboxylesterase
MWHDNPEYICIGNYLKGEPHMPFCQLEYGRIYYDEYGAGTPIMMIHPPAMGRKVFHYQQPLGENFHIILPDLGGHGDSETDKVVFSTTDYVKEVQALLDHLKIQKVVLCGYSSGGNIVQEFALTHPDRTLAIILCGGFPEVQSYILKYEHIVGMYMVKEHPHLLAKGISTAHTADKEIRDMIYDHMMKANRTTWFHCYHDSLKFSCIARLPELKVPLYLFYGSLDFTNKHIRLYKKFAPNVKTIVIKKVAHQLITKKPNEFNQAISRIVNELTK